MERRTPNKRKALANSNTTPNKIQKTNIPVSQSPKFVSKNNQIQNNGNKFKSNGNQKTTPKKRNMKFKQVEEDEEIESDNSLDEADSDEKLEIDEADSDDELEINEDNSDEEIESGEEAQIDEDEDADSDEGAQVDDEADSDEEAQVDNDEEADLEEDEADSEEEAQVDNDEEADSDEEAQVDNDEEADSDEEAQVDNDEEADSEEDEADSDKNADADNDDDDANETQNVDKEKEFSVFVKGAVGGIPMNRIFPDCKIKLVKKLTDKKNQFLQNAYVFFKDQESLKKALAIREVHIDGKIIKVEANAKHMEFTCFVRGIYRDVEVHELFDDCKILSFKMMELMGNPTGYVFVYFEDEESMRKALLKNETEFKGHKITVNIDSVISYSAFVFGFKQISNINYIFQDCSIKSIQVNPITNNRAVGRAVITFHDLKSFQNALLKNGTKYNDAAITVYPTKSTHENANKFVVFIRDLSSDAKIEDIFEDCNILFYYFSTDTHTKKLNGTATMFLQDEESVQKALMKHETEHNGSEIKVHRKDCFIFVRGIKEDTKIEEMFTGCKIHSIELKWNKITNVLAGAVVSFKDVASFEKAYSINMPSGIRVESMYKKNAPSNSKFGSNSNVFKSKFDKRPDNSGKLLLLKELQSQVQKLTEEIYGTERKPIYQKNTFNKTRPRFYNN